MSFGARSGAAAAARCGVLVSLAVLALAGQASATVTEVGAGGRTLVDGEPQFLIGLADPPPLGGLTPAGTDGLDEVVAGGVRIFRVAPPGRAPWSPDVLPPVLAWLDAAHSRGAMVWLSVRELGLAARGDERTAMLGSLVPTLALHPGLGFWRGVNEPYWAGHGVDSLSYAKEVVGRLDPAHAWLTVQAPKGSVGDLAPYSAVTDFHGVDVYPVRLKTNDPDLHAVGRWTSVIRRATPNEGVFMTLQICFTGAWHGSTYVLPTRRQERYMVYDAIMHGARGLIFYGGHDECLSDRDRALGWNWTFWNGVLKGVLRELGPGTALNEVLAGRASGVGVHVNDRSTRVISRRRADAVWVIVARFGKGAKTVRVSGLPAGLRAGRVYPTGGSRVSVQGGAFKTRIGRWGVQVIRFPVRG